MINFKFKKINFKTSAGFTVLESIVAIFVLSLAISGAFAAVQQSMSQSIIAKEEIKAFYLAQEAVEIIRNKRDANQLDRIINSSPNSWLYGISEDPSDPCWFGKVCSADALSMNLEYCGQNWESCPLLNQDPATYRYGYNINYTPTNFKREVMLERIGDHDDDGIPDEISVTVRITWGKGLFKSEFKAKTNLFNWI